MKHKDLNWGSYVRECLLEITEGESIQKFVDGLPDLMSKFFSDRLEMNPQVQGFIVESGEVAVNKGIYYAQRLLGGL